MGRTVAIGIQDFSKIRKNDYFYIDKTSFIREWWESGDDVTLIARPRRFGKTLNMSMLEQFFSLDYAGRGDLFEGLSIWQEEKYRKLQGSYPVISLSFANIKENDIEKAKEKIFHLIRNLYSTYDFLKKSNKLSTSDKDFICRIAKEMKDTDATIAIHQLAKFLYQYYGKKVIVLLDEYDTPMQEAYVHGFWGEITSFIRSMFNSTFKTNPYLERAVMTGITRVSKESIFSDLNNLEVVTTTSDKYVSAFGFTEEEVFEALEECDMREEKAGVKNWYDGFVFGKTKEIYNPWSILNFLDKKEYRTYWANTSSNSLVGKLIREGNRGVKTTFEKLLKGEEIRCLIDEQIVYNQLEQDEGAIWSLLLASGYLKAIGHDNLRGEDEGGKELYYTLMLTNREVRDMFFKMVKDWFGTTRENYNDFVKALLAGDVEAMNDYMNEITLDVFSYFDAGARSIRNAAEKFYHGFVLGLMVELRDRYLLTSNRESGYGRYDVMLEPKGKEGNAILIEFKVFHEKRERMLEDTLAAALKQIEEKQYEAVLISKGIAKERIRKYGFAFRGKEVLIGGCNGKNSSHRNTDFQ